MDKRTSPFAFILLVAGKGLWSLPFVRDAEALTEIRMTNVEFRKKSEARNPKERPRILHSDFDILSSFVIRISSFPGVPEEPDEIPVHDQLDVGGLESACRQEGWNSAQVGDGFQVGRGLFAPECAIKVRADSGMARVSRNLADP